jgi:hypothetical protein
MVFEKIFGAVTKMNRTLMKNSGLPIVELPAKTNKIRAGFGCDGKGDLAIGGGRDRRAVGKHSRIDDRAFDRNEEIRNIEIEAQRVKERITRD